MITVKINVEPHVAEYIRGKFFDEDLGAVKFPASRDIYVLIYDLLQRRPADHPVDTGNLEFGLPERRAGKDPAYYNYLSARAQKLINDKLRLMMWTELHDLMDENKHIRGIKFNETIYTFMTKYGIESITEDALFKNYQRYRYKTRRNQKRSYTRKSSKK